MIVDDEIDHIVCFRTALELHGYHIDAFTDPEEALTHFSPEIHDVVIADVKMPKITGFEFARKIHSIDKDTKIILMTAFHITKQEFDKVMPSTRVDALIKKPIGMTKLLDHLDALSGKNHTGGSCSVDSSSVCSFFASAGTTTMSLLLLSLQDGIAMFV
jgi:response regulator RpfG family c-di-GMP phosphodiesterase